MSGWVDNLLLNNSLLRGTASKNKNMLFFLRSCILCWATCRGKTCINTTKNMYIDTHIPQQPLIGQNVLYVPEKIKHNRGNAWLPWECFLAGSQLGDVYTRRLGWQQGESLCINSAGGREDNQKPQIPLCVSLLVGATDWLPSTFLSTIKN